MRLPRAVATTKNNGNIQSQTITVPTVGTSTGFTAVQTYNYDSLDRLTQVSEFVGTEMKWRQTFLYDRYGNRRFDSAQTTTIDTQLPANVSNPVPSSNNNRLKAEDGYEFDSSGNLVRDAAGNRFAYDANGKMTAYFRASNSGSTPDSVNAYDGDGKRVRKIDGNVATIFVYDANSKLIAEYSNETPAPNPAVFFVTRDDNESPRVVTDSLGKVVQRRDYLPFGEELLGGHGNRTENLGYSLSHLRHGFAGQQLDQETGHLYYGERYYSPSHGRFTSPDPLMASGGAANPQTWNRYSYVVNNPIAYVDSNGELRRDKNGKVVTKSPEKGTYQLSTKIPSTKGYWVTIKTDEGREIVAFQNSDFDDEAYKDLEYNCHGLTFTQGQLLIENDQVQDILDDDYTEVKLKDGEKPQVGDVVVYYSNDPSSNPALNGIVHSATVVATDGTIQGTQVAGLGGSQSRSRTTNVGEGWQDNGRVRYRIFRRNTTNQVEPGAQERAEIARTADKRKLEKKIKPPKVKIEKTINPRQLIPLPQRPA